LSKAQISKLISIGETSAELFIHRRNKLISLNGPLPRNLFIPNDSLKYRNLTNLSNNLLTYCPIFQTNPDNFCLNHVSVKTDL